MVPISPNNNNNSNNSIDGQTSSTSQPSITAIAATITATTWRRRIRTEDNNQNRASSCFGKFILIFFAVVTFFLCLGLLGTVLGPEFPTITAISASTSASHLDFSISLANPNENGLSYTNLRLTADYLVKVNAVEVRILFPSVASPEFDQAGGESRVVRFRVIRGSEMNDLSFLPEVEIQFRAKVRYKGHSWLVKAESDMRAKCKRVKAIELGKGIKMENPNCVVDGFWQTARIMMLGSTLVLPFLVLVFLSFSSYRSTTSPQD